MSPDDSHTISSTIPPEFSDWSSALHPYIVQEIMHHKGQLSYGTMDPPATPSYRAKAWDLWHMVFIIGFPKFCKDIWNTNMHPGKAVRRAVNREEAEVLWCFRLVDTFQTWDPRRVARKKDLVSAIQIKRKVLQNGILQIFETRRGDLDLFWSTMKQSWPQITIDHFTVTSADDFSTLSVFGEVWAQPAKIYEDLTPGELEGAFAADLPDNATEDAGEDVKVSEEWEEEKDKDEDVQEGGGVFAIKELVEVEEDSEGDDEEFVELKDGDDDIEMEDVEWHGELVMR
ncbi:hypothetical protein HYFRA_00002614 [Hymenoscyphus fraxineus]|uniref:Uncharacterized protein n=1 Tax=Hymenoscyphus fraxineus TaxID=746836 RepID=A0A9N9Q0T6_9HELO|nr:hypothetical protein HYFRA_00002614 [Hymenoscyphus fraxineus]